ncbi:MAG: N-acetylmuramoyl-L-alanine amidase [Candidatus Competibacteraceae bacterium]|nr:N-acetylmuramoyl-L-alanine amidase [Candidatus Competibacteraceae bacterium]
MQRIVCHWTAGGHKATELDRKHYHILVEGDGTLVQGFHSIKDNESTRDGRYAAHTRLKNTRSIGIAVCCMAGARQSPFDPGRFPMTEKQWRTMAAVATELCRAYRIEVKPTAVLGHGEVERQLGIRQRGKWDPMVLPWDPQRDAREVGDRFRDLVSAYLLEESEDDLPGAAIKALINGKSVGDVLLTNEEAFIKVSSLVRELNWPLLNASRDALVLSPPEAGVISLQPQLLDDDLTVADEATEGQVAELMMASGYVEARELAATLNLPLNFDTDESRLIIGASQRRRKARTEPLRVVVKTNDTLSAIAARHLGSASRWRELRNGDGKPFSEAEARQIAPGDVVLVPASAAPDPAPQSTVPADLASADLDIDALIDGAAAVLRRFARESVPVIAAECITAGVVQKAQIAYVLATSEHESKAGRFMTELWGPTAAQRRYEGRQDLGNTQPGDGFRFRGRGYVQITGRTNYQFWSRRLGLDLIASPDRVAQQPDIAARILVQGMRDGTFRPGHKLSRFINDDTQDFFNARAIINADREIVDRGQSQSRGTRIAELAQNYLAAMGG